MRIIEEIKKIDNHSLILYYDTKNKMFFGCDNAIENIFTRRQEKIFIKFLQDFIKMEV